MRNLVLTTNLCLLLLMATPAMSQATESTSELKERHRVELLDLYKRQKVERIRFLKTGVSFLDQEYRDFNDRQVDALNQLKQIHLQEVCRVKGNCPRTPSSIALDD